MFIRSFLESGLSKDKQATRNGTMQCNVKLLRFKTNNLLKTFSMSTCNDSKGGFAVYKSF